MYQRPRRRRRVQQENVEHEDLTKLEQVCEEFRQIQWQTNCSSKTLETFLSALRGKLGRLIKDTDALPRNVTQADRRMQNMVSMNYPKYAFPQEFPTCVIPKYSYVHRLGKRLFACTDALVVIAKSGDQRTLRMSVICVIVIVTTTTARPRSLLFTSR